MIMRRKFIAIGVSVVSTLALASCFGNKAKADYSTTRQVQEYEDQVKTAFHLFYDTDLTDAELLDTEAKEGSYYNLYVSKNPKDTLFAYTYDLTDYFSSDNGSRNSTVTVNTLSFEIQGQEALYDEEKTAILQAAYSKEKGVASKLDVDFDITTSTDYSRSFSTKEAYNTYKAGEKVSLSIVYMPVYVIHFVSNQPVLRNYVILPIYATFTTESGKEVALDGTLVDSKVSTISQLDLTKYFAESKNTLKAKITVTPVEPEEPTEEENKGNGLSAGAIVGIVLGSVFGGLLIIYLLLGFTLWRNGSLDGKFWRAIYKWIKRPSDKKKR